MELQFQIATEGIDFSSMRQLFDTMLQTANTFTPETKIAHLGNLIAMLKQLITGHKERVSTNLESPAAPCASSGILQRSRRVRLGDSKGTGKFPGVVGSADETYVVQPPSRSTIRPAVRERVEAFVKFAVAHIRHVRNQQQGCIDADSLVTLHNAAHPHLPSAEHAKDTFFKHHLVSMSSLPRQRHQMETLKWLWQKSRS
jgi:hypothetical protein